MFGSDNCYEVTPTDKCTAGLHANMLPVSIKWVYFSGLLSPLAVLKEKK